MKYIYIISIFFLFGCSNDPKQTDKTTESSRVADTILKEFNKVDKALSNAKKKVDSVLPSKQQEDSLLNIPRKLKRRFDSLIK